jgi:nucleoid DNA-binding protein
MPKRTLVEEAARQAQRKARRVVHKRQLIAEVARRTSLTQAQVYEALGGILEVVAETMADGNCVTLVGFGRFEANEHRPRIVQGRDGNTYHVGSRLVPSFRPYPSLRQRVREQAAFRESQGEEPCLEPRTSTPND